MTITPLRSLLVPLDGSPFAEQALPLAAEVARRAGAMLQLAMVHHPVPALATALEVPEIEAQLDQESRVREQTYLNGMVSLVQGTANVPVSSVLLDGAVADALHQHAEETGTDLLVMTTHGRGPMSRFWLGSVADQLTRRMHLPILLVRPQAEGAPPLSLQRVVVALDGSPFAEQVLPAALALGQPFRARFQLLFVVEPPVPIADPSGVMVLPMAADATKKLTENATGYLGTVAARLRKQGAEVTTHVVQGPTAAGSIIDQADALDADLIAVASHGAGGFARLVLGSVADKVIRGSNHPVLVVRPPETP